VAHELAHAARSEHLREHVSSTGDLALAASASPDTSNTALDSELAAEGAVVLRNETKQNKSRTREISVEDCDTNL